MDGPIHVGQGALERLSCGEGSDSAQNTSTANSRGATAEGAALLSFSLDARDGFRQTWVARSAACSNARTALTAAEAGVRVSSQRDCALGSVALLSSAPPLALLRFFAAASAPAPMPISAFKSAADLVEHGPPSLPHVGQRSPRSCILARIAECARTACPKQRLATGRRSCGRHKVTSNSKRNRA